MNTESLTPGEDLLLDVLIARHRLGEQVWTFQARHNRVLNTLAARGLVNYKSGTAEHTSVAWLTDEAERFYVTETSYTPPLTLEHAETVAFHEELARRGLLPAAKPVKAKDERVLVGLGYSMLSLIESYYRDGIGPGTLMKHFEDWNKPDFVRQAMWTLVDNGKLTLDIPENLLRLAPTR